MPTIESGNGRTMRHPIYFHIAAIGIAIFFTYVLLIFIPSRIVAFVWTITLAKEQMKIAKIVAPALPTITTIITATIVAIKRRKKKSESQHQPTESAFRKKTSTSKNNE